MSGNTLKFDRIPSSVEFPQNFFHSSEFVTIGYSALSCADTFDIGFCTARHFTFQKPLVGFSLTVNDLINTHGVYQILLETDIY